MLVEQGMPQSADDPLPVFVSVFLFFPVFPAVLRVLPVVLFV